MAILKITGKAASAKRTKNYLDKDKKDKTKSRVVKEKAYNILNVDHWDEEMENVKEIYDQKKGVQTYHLIQNFENEKGNKNYTVDEIFSCGCELAEKIAEKGCQVVVVTHTDSGLIHNHIIINSVNPETGKKLRFSTAKKKRTGGYPVDFYNQDLYQLNDEICKKHGLRTLTQSKQLKDEKAKAKGIQPENRKMDEVYLEEKGTSFKAKIRNSLQEIWKDESIVSADDFKKALSDRQLKISRVTSTGNVTYQDEAGHKARAKSLGDFNQNDVIELINRNRDRMKKSQELEQLKEQKNQMQRKSRTRSGGRGM